MRTLSHIIGITLVVCVLTACTNNEDTTGWKTYRNDQWGFEIQYPETYVVEETEEQIIVKRISDTISDRIILSIMQSTITEEVDKILEEAASISYDGSNIRDTNVRAAIATIQSGDAYSLFLKYFLVRTSDYAKSQPYPMMTAMVETYPEDPSQEDAMTVPEQILSTFRFL